MADFNSYHQLRSEDVPSVTPHCQNLKPASRCPGWDVWKKSHHTAFLIVGGILNRKFWSWSKRITIVFTCCGSKTAIQVHRGLIRMMHWNTQLWKTNPKLIALRQPIYRKRWINLRKTEWRMQNYSCWSVKATASQRILSDDLGIRFVTAKFDSGLLAAEQRKSGFPCAPK